MSNSVGSVSTPVLPPEIWRLISKKLLDTNSIINLSLTCCTIGYPILNDLKYILKQNPNISLQILFQRAIEENKIEFVTYLLDYVDIKANNNWALNMYLIFSSSDGYTEIVKLLLEKGADVTYYDTAALCKASENGHTDVARLLLEYGAGTTAKYNKVLLLASENGHTETVRLLLEYSGAAANLTVKYNEALFLASENGHLEVVELLERYTKE